MIISRYLTREVLYTLLIVTTVLLMAFLSQQLVRYMNYVAVGKIPTNVLLELVGFEIPYLGALLLPLGLYMGILLAFGRFYADHEMAILQQCGYGVRRLFRLTVRISIAVFLLVLILMLWVNPWISTKRQQVMGGDEATIHLIETMIPGRFQASPDGNRVMYVEKLSRDRRVAENVFLAQQKKNENNAMQNAWMLVLANRGYQTKDKVSQDQLFVTEDGYRYEGTPGQNDYKLTQYKKYYVRLPQNNVQISHAENESLSTSQLLHDYKQPKRAAEFQWRISVALSVIFLAMLAVPLSAVQPRQGRYLMLLPAILVYVVYINLLFIARRWLELGSISVTLGMWWVHLLVLLLVISASIFTKRN